MLCSSGIKGKRPAALDHTGDIKAGGIPRGLWRSQSSNQASAQLPASIAVVSNDTYLGMVLVFKRDVRTGATQGIQMHNKLQLEGQL